jgi:hypothetical protein
MRAKKPPLLSKLIAAGSLLLFGALLVGLTVWIMLYANEPQPNTDTQVQRPKNNPPNTDKW